MDPNPRILLADCDAMFCAVARLVDPLGAGKAKFLLVGGSAEGRGVVCSASYETRRFGVRSGMPMARALQLCPGSSVVQVPRKACGEKSREVAAVLQEWSPVVEPASIDEFYLSLAGTERLYRGESLAQTAERIRQDVLRRTGLTVSLGGGTNRLVAKLAVEMAKPHRGGRGVLTIAPGGEAAFVASLDLDAIPGIGQRFQERLQKHHLVTVRDALQLERSELQSRLGVRSGAWLYDRVRGRASARVKPRQDARSMSREETFAADLSTDEDLTRELTRLIDRLGQDLRRAGLQARTITVKLRDADFTTRSAAQTLRLGVQTREAIQPTALGLLDRLRTRRRVPARLIGISVSHLRARASTADQLSLFGSAVSVGESPRDLTLAKTVDQIRSRFGNAAIRPGVLTPSPSEPQSS